MIVSLRGTVRPTELFCSVMENLDVHHLFTLLVHAMLFNYFEHFSFY